MLQRCLTATILTILTVWMPLNGNEAKKENTLSPKKARNYSILTTIVPMAAGFGLVVADPEGESGLGDIGALLFWAGGTFGPGTGYLYAHHPWGFWRGALVRTIGLGAITVAVAITWDDPDASGGWEFFIAGSALYVGSGIFDIVNSAKSARHYNNKHDSVSVSLKPCYIANQKAAGLMFSIKF